MINLGDKNKKELRNKNKERTTDITVEQTTSKSFKKIKRKFKVISFFLVYLVLFSAIVSVGGYLIYNNQFSYSNSAFNPDGNLNYWNSYYAKHKKDHNLIDLNNMTNYFNNNNINVSISDPNQKDKTLNFNNFINNIDGQLIKATLEANDISSDSNSVLPNKFFQNVIYNPDVNFTVADGKGNQVDAQTFQYQMNDTYGSIKKYALKMNINKDANNFGINVNKDTTITININITNSIIFDISTLDISFDNETISMENGTMTVADMLAKNPQIEKDMADKFVKELSSKVTKKVTDGSYTIKPVKPNDKVDFNNSGVGNDVAFTITATDQAKDIGFKGTLTNQIVHITNTQIDLSTLGDTLGKKIVNAYKGKTLQVTVNNDKNNGDTNLSQAQITDVNSQINKTISSICQDYFTTNYPALKVDANDYIVSSDLKVKDKANIFNQGHGILSNLTIAPTDASTKFKKEKPLEGIAVTIIGKNNNVTGKEWKLPDDFANQFEGIWVPNDLKKHILQDGGHWYSQNGQSSTDCQDSLLQELVTNPKNGNSLLNTIKNNSYKVEPNSFTGKFIFKGSLDGYPWPTPSEISFDVSTISNPTKGINNFFDLLSNTKSISLYTNVAVGAKTRTLNNVAINFYSKDDSDAADLLYSFDLSSLFTNSSGDHIAISQTANLSFTTFSADLNYNQWN